MNSTKHHIHLHGKLAEFGAEFELAINTPLEAVRALALQVTGFATALAEGEYYVIRGKDPERGRGYSGEDLAFQLADGPQHVHFIPVVAGAKNGGVGKAILGGLILAVALIGAIPTGGGSLIAGLGEAAAIGGYGLSIAGATVTWGAVAALGAAMLLGGVSQLIQGAPRTDYNVGESADQRASFFLSGQVNQYHQGGPIPLPYGRIRVGSTVVSAGLTAENVNV